MRKFLTNGLIAAAALLLGVPALADQPEDAFITTKVKMELLTADNVDPMRINVDTLDGVVTLHGQVESAAAKSKAARPSPAENSAASSGDIPRCRTMTVPAEPDNVLPKAFGSICLTNLRTSSAVSLNLRPARQVTPI